MNHKLTATSKTKGNGSMGDKVRQIADQLKQETNIQIKATSRILGAAAQIAVNHDRLINEVVEMVEEDLNNEAPDLQNVVYTVDNLKKRFKTLNEAKLYFELKASSWSALVKKLNERSSFNCNTDSSFKASVLDRLAAIENEIKTIHREIAKVLDLLKKH